MERYTFFWRVYIRCNVYFVREFLRFDGLVVGGYVCVYILVVDGSLLWMAIGLYTV